MSVLAMRRAVATGTAPEEAFLQVAPPFATTSELAAGARGLRQSLEGIDAPLGALLSRPGVTDVLVNSPEEAWIDAGHGLERVEDFHLDSAGSLRQMAVRMAAAAGQRLDDATPIVDATLPSGVRLHAVLPPLSGASTVLSLRVPAPLAMSPEQLIASGMITPWLAEVLGRLVQGKVSGLVTGATGTGKTTLLACLLGLIDPGERLICIEEVSELRPNHPHVVHLQARKDNVQGAGGVSLSDLVKAAMRMRPDRLILGEARGPEVREMLSALNTGHRGGWATIHANSAVEVPARLEALGALAGMSRDTVCAQALPAFEVVVHLRRFQAENGRVRRQVVQLARLCRNARGELAAEAVLEIGADGVARGLTAWPEFAARLGLPVRIPSGNTGFDAGAGGAGGGVDGAGGGDTPPSAGGSGGAVGSVGVHEGIALGRRRLDG
ncbi:TadA family conjugal transfer-associated ATPase [Mobiluncus mulieris]|uniref:TadA family conjugal transfer-associated ATPase n=1 Tax=Mobiluncus mulieris TaxID=2052 RepID=UPI00242B00F8|nr:TadA family conjugal transfer-associated ATPase [Mobiluncus mulieris]